MEIKTDKNGFKYYEEIPEGWRQATVEDFYDKSGRFIINKPFLVKSYHTETYQCYRSHNISLLQKIKPWMEDGRVFVLS